MQYHTLTTGQRNYKRQESKRAHYISQLLAKNPKMLTHEAVALTDAHFSRKARKARKAQRRQKNRKSQVRPLDKPISKDIIET